MRKLANGSFKEVTMSEPAPNSVMLSAAMNAISSTPPASSALPMTFAPRLNQGPRWFPVSGNTPVPSALISINAMVPCGQ